jgi:hypothetical protein
MEPVAKPKKFVLPRFYLRTQHDVQVVDELLQEDNIICFNITSIVETEAQTIVEVQATQNTKPKKSKSNAKNAKSKKVKEIETVETEDNIVTEIMDAVETVDVVEATKTKRQPSAYNIYIKETLARLNGSHGHMTPKERFSLAIHLWNESKQNK